MSTSKRHGLGDPRIGWMVLLDAWLRDEPTDPSEVLASIHAEAGWPPPPPIESREDCLQRWTETVTSTHPLRAAQDGHRLALAGDHRHVDGLGMLAALGRLAGEPLASDARGLAGRATRSLAVGGTARMLEIAFRPCARLAPTAAVRRPFDALASRTLAGRVRTADLVAAAAAAFAALAGGHRQVSIAVGVSTDPRATTPFADHSGYLRITGAQHLDAGEIADALRSAPVDPGSSGSPGLLARVATSVAAPRLGSSLLVSHLGTIATERVEGLAFYPVSGGTSGVSMGAATLLRPDGAANTTLTLRARGSEHADGGLRRLLEATINELNV